MKEKRTFGTRLVGGWMHLHGRLPLRFHHACAGGIAWLLQHVVHYRADVVLVNLSRSFPEKPYKEIQSVRNRFYRHLANIFTEAVWFGACRGDKGRKRLQDSHLVEITNPEVLNDALERSRQVMILQTHTGNWELVGGLNQYAYGPALRQDPSRIAVTYDRLSSPLWDRVMADNRTAPVADQGFDGYTEAREVLRFAVRHRNEPFTYIFITDQYPYRFATRHDAGTFMKQHTVTMDGAAVLALKMDMAVLYLRFREREEGGYSITFIPVEGDSPEEIMKTYYRLLEEDLKAQPWNYLWTHKRWK